MDITVALALYQLYLLYRIEGSPLSLEGQRGCRWQERDTDDIQLPIPSSVPGWKRSQQWCKENVEHGTCSKAATRTRWDRIRFSWLLFSSEAVFRMTPFLAVPSVCRHLLMGLGAVFWKNRAISFKTQSLILLQPIKIWKGSNLTF